MTSIKSHMEEVMYGRRSSPVVAVILLLLSLPYGLLISLRKLLFAAGIFRRKKLDQHVISVGNLTLGGTGKTPAVMSIAEVILKHGGHPVVISRGYGRRDEGAITVVSDGIRLCADAAAGGDEPVLIASKLTGVPVVADSDRFRAGRFAQDRFNMDTVILDDAFQHIGLRRDLDIVLLDATDPFGNGRLFPAGILREPLSGLARADAILITGVDRAVDLPSLKRTVSSRTRAKIFSSQVIPTDLVDVMSGERKPLAALRGTSAVAVAGIARPAAFVSLLRSLGTEIKKECLFCDHYIYTKSDLAAVYQTAADTKVNMIVTTEKDGVRLRNLKPQGIWALRVELKIHESAEWDALLTAQ